ncbi:MAG: penicillin acylase family protein [candidate division Zixibacteria bacterium]|nr:penicillin acylase family protein [candidate division Zixibacteria bacterium]
MKPATRRALKGLLFAVTGLVVGFVIAGYVLLQRSLPVTDGTIMLAGLRDEVTITFDSLGIPQIWAHNETDAPFALGYQHAADRMFQMDLIRRLSQGRLSEMLGSITIEIDKQQRMIGHARLALKARDSLSDHNRRRLQAYADGVNAYHESCRSLPFEYRLLPVDFEPWTVYDCLTILSFQTWFSDALQNSDEFYLELTEKLSDKQLESLLPVYPDWAETTVPEAAGRSLRPPTTGGPSVCLERDPVESLPSVNVNPATVTATSGSTAFQKAAATALLDNLSAPLRMTGASNSWVVAPDRSVGGRAMLAADPHLEIGRLPQFWYAVGMHVEKPSYGVLGVTVPGLPFVVMGHNGAAAWSFTAGGVDVTDYFEERLDPDDSLRVLTPSGYEPLEIIIDTIYASDNPPIELRTRLTRHGPVMIDNGDKLYSLKWAGHDADLDAAVGAGFELHRVITYDRFRLAVTRLGALNANYMYADSAGNIGYQLGTPIPVRLGNDGHRPGRGWTSDDDWKGYYPLDETPHAYNPPQGWLASCNNLPSRSVNLSGNFAADRILRITDLLRANAEITVDDMATWQLDHRDEYLLRWETILTEALIEIGEARLTSRNHWDGQTTVESTAMPIMVLFLNRLKQLTFQDELGTLSARVSKLTLDRLYHSEATEWFDDITTPDYMETREEIAQRAAREAVDALCAVQSREAPRQDRRWGDVHTLTMRHPMASVPVVNFILDLKFGPWPHSGSPGSLNASFYSRRDDTTYTCIVGPSWRFVIDFADVDVATMVLPAGNSGNPMSPHFFDFNEMWRRGERWTVPFSRDKVLQRAVSTLSLQPRGSTF